MNLKEFVKTVQAVSLYVQGEKAESSQGDARLLTMASTASAKRNGIECVIHLDENGELTTQQSGIVLQFTVPGRAKA